jgi:hypothetical protein
LATITAIIGLLGVVLGAGVAALAAIMLARRDDQLRARTAKRLFCLDLYKTQALIAPIRATGNWGIDRQTIPYEAYGKHSDNLARLLKSMEWKRVEGTVLGIQRLRDISLLCARENRKPNATELEDFERIGRFLGDTLIILDTESHAIDHSDSFFGYHSEETQ